MDVMRRLRKPFSFVALISAPLLAAQTQPPPQVSDSPDSAMMAPVRALANYMGHVEAAVAPTVFMENGLVIVENFAPYIFSGKDAAEHWDVGYRHHVVGRLKDLQFSFGVAHDFDRTGDRVYFVLPTTWRGIYQHGRFEEHGAWSFVLEKLSGQWRIIAYTWGVTDETDWPTAPALNGGDASRPSKEAEGAVLAADAAWLKTYVGKDVDKSVALCDEQGSLLWPNSPIATGKNAIAKLTASAFAIPDFTLVWHPDKVGVAGSGDLGYTSGTYDWSYKDPSGKAISDKGKYLTVWKKQADGSWKVLFDMFNTDLPTS
jgi:ketosteroid isomerase-like protein